MIFQFGLSGQIIIKIIDYELECYVANEAPKSGEDPVFLWLPIQAKPLILLAPRDGLEPPTQ